MHITRPYAGSSNIPANIPIGAVLTARRIEVVGEMKASGIKNWYLIVNPDGGYIAAHPEQRCASFLHRSLEQSIEAFKLCEVQTGASGKGKSQRAIFESTGIWKHKHSFGNTTSAAAKLSWASVRQPPHSCPENYIRSGARRRSPPLRIHRLTSTADETMLGSEDESGADDDTNCEGEGKGEGEGGRR